MVLNIGRKALFAGLLASFAGLACAADVTRHVLGAKKLAFSAADSALDSGYYAAAMLSAVDTDLAPGNIKPGVTIFGVTGGADNALPAPTVGGTWLLIPGNSSLGTRDFYVQKYEAKNVNSLPTSQASGLPWRNITQAAAKNRCEVLGPGYHLISMMEAQTINRNIENNAWNWTGGSVGSGGLWRGHTDNAPANSLAADVIDDPDDNPYVGTGNTGASIERRAHKLSSGQFIWDWSGNAWEWVDMTCMPGTAPEYWYNSGVNWLEWSDGNLSDYEKERAGPEGNYTSMNNAGRYYGCYTPSLGKAVIRGGYWFDGANAGVFAFHAGNNPLSAIQDIGFRCAR